MIFANSQGKNPHTLDALSPLGETALVTAVSILSSEAIGNHSTGAEDDWTDQNKGPSGDETPRAA